MVANVDGDRLARIADTATEGAKADADLKSFHTPTRVEFGLQQDDMDQGIPDPATADEYGDACYSIHGRKCVKYSDYPTRQSRILGNIWRVRFSTHPHDASKRGIAPPAFFPPAYEGNNRTLESVGASKSGMSGLQAIAAGWEGHN